MIKFQGHFIFSSCLIFFSFPLFVTPSVFAKAAPLDCRVGMLSAEGKASIKLLLSFGYDSEVAQKIVSDYPELVAQIKSEPELGKPILIYRGIPKSPQYVDPNQELAGAFLGTSTHATLFTTPNISTATWYALKDVGERTAGTVIEYQIPKFMIDGYVDATLDTQKKMIELSTLTPAERDQAISKVQGKGSWEILFDLTKLKRTFTFTKRIGAVVGEGQFSNTIAVENPEIYSDIIGKNHFFWLPMNQLSLSSNSHALIIPDAIRSKLKYPRLYWWQPVE